MNRFSTNTRQLGYTLLELMITVAIITIVASIALPSYQQHVMRSHRGDAMVALLRIAKQQEKWYMQNNTYSSSVTDLKVPTTEAGYYTLAVTAADTDTFSATATVKTGAAQANDKDCTSFTIDAEGARTAKSSGGSDNSAVCWR